MTSANRPTALIAEDEPLLAVALRASLAKVWPELEVLAVVGDGASAVRRALEHRPEVLFFDIRMPGLGGLEAAAELAEVWDTTTQTGRPFPALVFVTAYDQYAVQAFENQAMDYLLKPVQNARLQKTVARLQQELAQRAVSAATPREPAAVDSGLEHTLAQLRQLLATADNAPARSPASGGTTPTPTAPAAPLTLLQVSVGNSIRMVPLDEVLYIEAADKYLRVLTPEHEYLIRTPLRELLPQLDGHKFWQVHRATVVRAQAIAAVQRDEAGKLWLQLHGRSEKLAVSRLYAYLFKAM